jgi:F-box and WD-40 domain protein 1/11
MSNPSSTSALVNPSFGLAAPFYTPLNRHFQPSSMLTSAYSHHNAHLNHRPLPTYNNHITATHTNLVRSVILGPEFIITGSYDLSIKIWCRQTGMLISDLTGGHIGKIFCVAADRTKVVSCGEDMRICVWDFGVGIETGYVKTEW